MYLIDLSTIYFADLSGCRASFVCSCHCILERYGLFSGVKLSIRPFCFIYYCPQDAGMWPDALRIAKEYAPHKVSGILY